MIRQRRGIDADPVVPDRSDGRADVQGGKPGSDKDAPLIQDFKTVKRLHGGQGGAPHVPDGFAKSLRIEIPLFPEVRIQNKAPVDPDDGTGISVGAARVIDPFRIEGLVFVGPGDAFTGLQGSVAFPQAARKKQGQARQNRESDDQQNLDFHFLNLMKNHGRQRKAGQRPAIDRARVHADLAGFHERSRITATVPGRSHGNYSRK